MYLLPIILQLAFQNFHMVHKHGSNYVESYHSIDLNFHKGQNRLQLFLKYIYVFQYNLIDIISNTYILTPHNIKSQNI